MPTLQELKTLNALYNASPESFTEEGVDNLQRNNLQFGQPLQRHQEAGDFNLLNSVENLAAGFIEGFTTLPVGEWLGLEHNDTISKIMYKLGNLAGFVGYIPGPGLLGKLGASAVGKAIGLAGLGERFGASALNLMGGLANKSIPLLGGSAFLKGLEKTGITAAMDATKFLSKSTMLGDMVRGGLELGAASAVGAAPIYDLSGDSILNKRLPAFGQGAMFGASMRAIGNVFARGGKYDLGEILYPGDALALKDPALLKKQNAANAIMRAISSSIYMGGIAATQGAPTEDVIYETLLGAWFGKNEVPKHLREMRDITDKFLNKSGGNQLMLVKPERYIDNWDSLDPKVKREFKIQAELQYGGTIKNGDDVLTQGGIAVNETLESVKNKLTALRDNNKISEKDYNDAITAFNAQKQIQEKIDTGVPEAKAIEQVADKQKTEIAAEGKTQQVAGLIADMVNRVNKTGNEDKILTKQITELEESYDGVDSRFQEPFQEVASKILFDKGIESDNLSSYLDTEKKVVEISKKFLGDKNSSADDIENAIKKKFGIKELNPETKRRIQNLHVKVSQAEVRQEMSLKPDGISTPKTTKSNGVKWYPSSEAPPELKKTMGDIVELKQYEDGKEEMPLYEAMDKGLTSEDDIIKKIADIGMVPITGRKDNSNILMAKPLITEEDASRIIDALPKELRDEYDKASATWSEDMKDTNTFIFANNIEMQRRMNSFDTLQELNDAWVQDGDGKEKRWLLNPVALNKRAQVLNDRSPRLSKDAMIAKDDNTIGDNFRFTIFNTLPTNKPSSKNFAEELASKKPTSTMAKGEKVSPASSIGVLKSTTLEDNTYYYTTSDGKTLRHDAHYDGGMKLRWDVFDRMAKAFGFNPEDGFIKGIQVHTGDSDYSIFLAKHGVHRASPVENQWMIDNNIHGIHNRTTAKAIGKRELTSWSYENGGIVAKGMKTYELPWESFSGISDAHTELNNGVKFVKQAMTNIEDPVIQDKMLNDFVKPAIEGTDLGRQYIEHYNKTGELPKNFHIDNIGLRDKLEILNNSPKGGKLWEAIVKDILHIKEGRIQEENDLGYFDAIDADVTDISKEAKANKDLVQKILSFGITPAKLRLPRVRNYFDAALKRYSIESLIAPKMRYGGKFIIRPHSADVAEALGGIKRGHFYADNGLKELKIGKVNGKEVTLEEAYDKKDQLEYADLLTSMGVRVPADSPAGIRKLIFDGFTGIEHSKSIMIHPEDMKMIGGADTDGDTMFMYFNLPKYLQDYYESKKNIWKGGKDNGAIIEPKQSDWMTEKRQELFPFDPVSAIKVNKAAYGGNSTLGPGLNLVNTMKIMLREVGEGKSFYGYTSNGKKRYKATFKKGANKILERIGYDIVNYAADAADGVPLKQWNKLRAEIFNRLFDISAYEKGKKPHRINANEIKTFKNKKGEEVPYNIFNPRANPRIAHLLDLNTIQKGHDINGRRYSYIDMLNLAAKTPTGKDAYLGLYPKVFGEIGKLGEVVKPEGIESWLGPQTNFEWFLQRMTQEINKKLPVKGFNRALELAGLSEMVATGKKKVNGKYESVYEARFNQKVHDLESKKDKFGKQMYDKVAIVNKANEYASELAMQDLYDFASVLNTISRGNDLLKLGKSSKENMKSAINLIKEIQQKVWNIKTDVTKLEQQAKDDKSGNVTKKLQEIDKEIIDYHNSLTQPQAKKYFESLLAQSNKPTFIKSGDGRLSFRNRKQNNAIEQKLLDKLEKSGNKKVTDAQGEEVTKKDLIERIKAKNKALLTSNASGRYLDNPIVSDNTLKGITDNFQKLVDYTLNNTIVEKALAKKDKSASEIIDAFTKGISETTKQPEEPIGKTALEVDRVISPIFDRHEKVKHLHSSKMFDDVKSRLETFLVNNPQIIKDLDGLYATFTQDTDGVYKSLTDASLKDLEVFVNTLETYKTEANDGGLVFKKRLQYYLPSRLNDLFLPYDDGTMEAVVKLKQGDNIKDAKMRIPLTRMGKQHILMTNVMQYKSDWQRKVDNWQTDTKSAKIIAQIVQHFPEHIKDLYFISRAEREYEDWKEKNAGLTTSVETPTSDSKAKGDLTIAKEKKVAQKSSKVIPETSGKVSKGKPEVTLKSGSPQLPKIGDTIKMTFDFGTKMIDTDVKIVKMRTYLDDTISNKGFDVDLLNIKTGKKYGVYVDTNGYVSQFEGKGGLREDTEHYIKAFDIDSQKQRDKVTPEATPEVKKTGKNLNKKSLNKESEPTVEKSPHLREHYEKAVKLLEKYKDNKYNINLGKGAKPYTTREVVDMFKDDMAKTSVETLRDYIWADKDFEKQLRPYMHKATPTGKEWLDVRRVLSKISQMIIRKEVPPWLGVRGLEYLVHQWKVQNMDYKVTELRNGKLVTKTIKPVDYPMPQRAALLEDLSREPKRDANGDIIYDANGKVIPKYPWLNATDTYSIISREARDKFANIAVKSYVPHIGGSQKQMKAKLVEALEKSQVDGDIKEAARTMLKIVQRYGYDKYPGMESQDLINELEALSTNRAEEMEDIGFYNKVGNLLGRDIENPITDYDVSLDTWGKYRNNIVSNYWNKLAALTSDFNIREFVKETKSGKNKVGAENSDAWELFMRDYVRQTLGYPVTYAKEVLDDKKYKLKGHPYYWVTEQNAIDAFDKFNKFLGLEDKMPKAVRDELIKQKIWNFSNLEAKVSLLTLLTSPKTFIVNLGMANINTSISAGWKYWKQSGDLRLLKTINPKWTNWEAVEKDIETHGGIESFIKSEASLSQQWNSANGRRALDRIIRALKRNPNAEDKTIREILKEERVGEAFTEMGGWFMRKSERLARRKSWLTHYLKAREVLDASNSAYKWDDPWLIEMANKGVTATQFLYNNANRPAFTRTALGKVFSRFQLFAINSIQWRRDMLRHAKQFQWDRNSDSVKQFSRLTSTDMFVMALAAMLPYGIFNSSLPPPLNYFKDFAEFLFGDKETRDKAFFGTLPYPANILQPILPPSSRFITAPLTALATGDWDSFASYQVWTWFPFGRIAHDVKRTIDNPYLFMERMFGIPYNTLIRHKEKKSQ